MDKKKKDKKKSNGLNDKVVSFRLKGSELNELDKKKDELQLKTISDYVRFLVRNEEVKIKQVYVEDPEKIELLRELIFQIRKIGVNINQIAYGVNLGQPIPFNFYEETGAILNELNKRCKNILADLERDFEKKEYL
ncbi:plasmid mobilization relaxosome protein MobC [Porphyromonas levii]|uniref:Plasmid mobilization relaxosome protein MobC n=1 Tax=Porphyromonas levii TaxID=28114 RepID=A0A4Y8WNS2_9PORP|nr:plasmid mobilization relaxosome protein MobC [Porphyromonas levii]MBR8758992.1 hypothetical protein [Porphyromonas levii]MBR8766033.1 hypothetical protein [Porphyromonas levii]MBR8773555.1 hypothetical protein [Porphyromonas levii]MBR8801763.1 hypothetical protein [Porphyromonas levii]TFH93910.1 plasmid mobilization relaxosome protein MobC [Porphyromonas levii]